jgi:hypothetical protein
MAAARASLRALPARSGGPKAPNKITPILAFQKGLRNNQQRPKQARSIASRASRAPAPPKTQNALSYDTRSPGLHDVVEPIFIQATKQLETRFEFTRPLPSETVWSCVLHYRNRSEMPSEGGEPAETAGKAGTHGDKGGNGPPERPEMGVSGSEWHAAGPAAEARSKAEARTLAIRNFLMRQAWWPRFVCSQFSSVFVDWVVVLTSGVTYDVV